MAVPYVRHDKLGTIMKRLAIGVDVGGTNTVTGLIDETGNIVGQRTFKTRDYPVFEEYAHQLVGEIEALRSLVPDAQIAGIGIGAPNSNPFTGFIEDPVNIQWYDRNADGSRGMLLRHIPLVSHLKQFYPTLPIAIDNDANAAAVGEMIYGGAQGMRDFIEITLGTGLGSGVVANGQLIRGHGGMAGELGHVILRPEGRVCGCGRRGCLETYVSATGIVRTLMEVMADDLRPSQLRSLPPERIDSRMIAEAAQAGDPLAQEAFERTGMLLGEALANFVAFSQPEAIFLFGGLTAAGQLLWAPVQRSMEQHMMRNYRGQVKLLPSGLPRSEAAILGASALVWQELRHPTARR